jgi:hypothetical protein
MSALFIYLFENKTVSLDRDKKIHKNINSYILVLLVIKMGFLG